MICLDKKSGPKMEPIDSVGVRIKEYSQIIIFRDKCAFTEIVKANPHMKAIFGLEENEERAFPGLYIAAI